MEQPVEFAFLSPADDELARRAADGDHAGFGLLAERHRGRLIRWMTSLIGDADEAESLAQEALTRAFQQMATFKPERSFAAWLNGIALNLCRHHLRACRRHAEIVDPAAFQHFGKPHQPGVLSAIVSREQFEAALAAIDELPFPLREAFVLHEMEDFDYGEMANMCGVAEGTLRVHVHRAKALLRNRLGSVVDTWFAQGSAGRGQG